MEDMKQASVYSGDSAYSIPTQTIPPSCLDTIRSSTTKLAESKCIWAHDLPLCDPSIWWGFQANPLASRTVTFVSKAIGYPLDKYAALVMPGKSLNDLGFTKEQLGQLIWLNSKGIPVEGTLKMYQGQPHAADMIASGQIQLMVVTILIKSIAGN
ncbi:carbamoyl-phosphate synthase large chain, chloroplastic-like [Gossypium arboreum]|uniref:Uncharacterized protein n=1 Tax=Gossypium arboreum TaxID=29729 RepID=A0ABR0MHJ8_GOSAR|nr:carbamoyl-phosphate synthase large chain, chloroplastic-like [Gossypium arboreum]KAK5772616.1 hypothetical protein PVK06_048909 [Gossypium arboreum]